MGLIGGSGGGVSVPFFKDAPAGKLMVSITEVVERNMGSDISALLIDFFRKVPVVGMMAAAPELNTGATGVEAPETGGVFFAENGGTGDGWGRNEFTLGLGAPGDGRGDAGRPGENWCIGGVAPGVKRGDIPLDEPWPVCMGWRCLDSK
jgi:hypothetical protein